MAGAGLTSVVSEAGAGREGQALPTCSFLVTRDDLLRYAEASGDHNPIHREDDAARALGLPGVVAHGMYTMALAARAVEEWAGEGAVVRELGCRFSRPVHVPAQDGAVVTVGGRVSRVEEQDGAAVVHLALEVTTDEQAVLSAARAVVVEPAG